MAGLALVGVDRHQPLAFLGADQRPLAGRSGSRAAKPTQTESLTI